MARWAGDWDALSGGYTVIPDNPPRTVIPGGGTIVEGNSGFRLMNVNVSLSAPSARTVTVEWSTLQLAGAGKADGTNGNDYMPVAGGTVAFWPGETSKTVSFPITGDTLDEVDEKVYRAVAQSDQRRSQGIWAWLGRHQGR